MKTSIANEECKDQLSSENHCYQITRFLQWQVRVTKTKYNLNVMGITRNEYHFIWNGCQQIHKTSLILITRWANILINV